MATKRSGMPNRRGRHYLAVKQIETAECGGCGKTIEYVKLNVWQDFNGYRACFRGSGTQHQPAKKVE